MPQLLSQYSRDCEPQLLKPKGARIATPKQKKRQHNEKLTHHNYSIFPHSPQLEKIHAWQQRPSMAKKKKKLKQYDKLEKTAQEKKKLYILNL